jgi:hypothetical protein
MGSSENPVSTDDWGRVLEHKTNPSVKVTFLPAYADAWRSTVLHRKTGQQHSSSTQDLQMFEFHHNKVLFSLSRYV